LFPLETLQIFAPAHLSDHSATAPRLMVENLLTDYIVLAYLYQACVRFILCLFFRLGQDFKKNLVPFNLVPSRLKNPGRVKN